MRSRPAALALVFALALAGGCSKGDESSGGAKKKSTTTTSASDGESDTESADDPAETGDPPAVDAGPTTTLGGPLGNIEPPTTAPPGEVEVVLSRAIAGSASGEPEVRCVTGKGFFDVVLSFEGAPSSLGGGMALVSISFGAPGFKGPGKYPVDVDQGAYAVTVENTEANESVEFFAPESGFKGSVEVADGAKSGKFELRGLVDFDDRPLDVTGQFTCGSVESM